MTSISVSSAVKAMLWATSGCTLHFLLFLPPFSFFKRKDAVIRGETRWKYTAQEPGASSPSPPLEDGKRETWRWAEEGEHCCREESEE